MRYISLLLLIVSLAACKKSEDRRCWKGAGDLITVEKPLESFNRLFIGPNIRVVLIQDSLDIMKVTAGENLVNFITNEVIEGQLRVENTNKCNFLRSYKHQVEVEIHFTSLSQLYFEGTKEISTTVPISSNDFNIIIRDGAGAVNLALACNKVNVTVTNGWGNFNLRGSTNKLHLDIRNNGFGNTRQLNVANELSVVTSSAGRLEVNAATTVFNAQISSSGDIWYTGIPTFLNFVNYGSGSLVDKN